MPTFLLGSLFGLPRWLWGLGVIVAFTAGTLVAVKVHDHRVIAQHQAAQAAADAKASLEAERRANTQAAADETKRQERASQAQQDMRHAEDAHPEAARSAAGPVSRAALDRLRTYASQQHAAP